MFAKFRSALFVAPLRTYARKSVKKPQTDAGIARRRQLLEVDEPNEDFDDFESDFSFVHKSHKEHVQEMEAWHEKQRYLVVRNKYFKEKLPNFLTWHDKEQIRYLYSQNPEEWSVEVLSDAFPALPDVIAKIVKSNFTKNTSKIANHDRSVRENWEKFKKGEFKDLPPDLQRHLNKFSNRALNFAPFQPPLPTKNQIEPITKDKIKNGEFSAIITSYKQLKDKQNNFDINTVVTEPKPVRTFDSDSHATKFVNPKSKSVTLHDLQRKIALKAEQSDAVLTEEEKLILYNVKSKSGEHNLTKSMEKDKNGTELIDLSDLKDIVKNRNENQLSKESKQNNSVGFTKKRDYGHLVYPDRIQIPKNLYREGADRKSVV